MIFKNFQIPLNVSIQPDEKKTGDTAAVSNELNSNSNADSKSKESAVENTSDKTVDNELKEIIGKSVASNSKSMKRKKFEQSTSSLYEESLKRRSLRVLKMVI